MNNEQLKKEIVKYIRDAEGDKFGLGTEFEHFIINSKTLESYNYLENHGLKVVMSKIMALGWAILIQEDEHVLGLIKEGNTITLEPGSQIEISIRVCENIEEIDKIYCDVIREIKSVLTEDQLIVSLGYHPKTQIEDIPFLPKKRYEFMSEYLKKQGKFAHNMMKGTASTQVAIDFSSEEDFIKKFRVANFLSPFLSRIFDASPIFQGEMFKGENLRIDIWNNMDGDRSKIVPLALDKKFSYVDYAEYILNLPPILVFHNNEYIFTEGKKVKEITEEYNFNSEEVLHLMSMPFPDVRVKNYIEIRMPDAINYPLNLGIPALIKGIFYKQENLDKYYALSLKYNNEDIEHIKSELIAGIDVSYKGLSVQDVSEELIRDGIVGLGEFEACYLKEILAMIENKTSYSRELKALYRKDRVSFLKAISVGGYDE